MINREFSIGVGNEQDIGLRKEQEDYFATTGLESIKAHGGFLAVIADGMGGHADGGNASLIAVDEFMAQYKKKTPTESIPEALYRALLHANKTIDSLNRKDNSNRGTTLVACVVQGKRFYWVSVGDSYLFHYTNGKLIKINRLHTVGTELSNEKPLIEGPTQVDTRKNKMLTSYLGLEDIPEIDPSKKCLDWKPRDLKLGDKLLLCSDGLVNTLNLDEIQRCLQNPQETQQICEQLINQAKDKNRREQDNITVILLEMKPGVKDTDEIIAIKKANKKNIAQKHWLSVVLILLVALLIVGIMFVIKRNYYNFSWFNWSQEPVSSPVQDITPRTTSGPSCPSFEEKDRKEQKGKSCVIVCFPDLNRLKVQQILKSEEFYDGRAKIDGVWGPETRDAVKKFQEKYKLKKEDLDGETCQKLADIYSRQKTQIDNISSDPKQTEW